MWDYAAAQRSAPVRAAAPDRPLGAAAGLWTCVGTAGAGVGGGGSPGGDSSLD